MPLSEHEQRLLEQIEQALYAEDPKFARTYRSKDLRSHYRVRVIRAAIGFALGLGLLLAGVVTKIIWIGVLGFVAMLAAAVFGVASWQRMSGRREATSAARAAVSAPRRKPAQRRGMIARLEQRWQRRQDGNGR